MASKVAIVTGANKGLGFAVVKGLCEKISGTVYLTARDEKRSLDAVKKLNDLGLKPEYHQLDVTDGESVKRFEKHLRNKHGGFDYLVNNAAILDWKQVYPNFETAKRSIDTNFKSLLTIEDNLYPLLRDGGRVVNISGSTGHLSNLKNQKWIETLRSPDLTREHIVKFVDDYLDSLKNGTFKKEDFNDDGKHAELRVSKIALTALTMLQQRKYKNVSINAMHPGFLNTDLSVGLGKRDPDDAAKNVLYLLLEAAPELKGAFMWHDRTMLDWYDPTGDYFMKGVFW